MNQPQTEKEARKFPRIPKEVFIDVTKVTYPMPEGSGEHAKGKDIAKEGISFIGAERYESGISVILKIKLLGWQQHKKNTSSIVDASAASAPLTAVAEVVWSRKLSDGSGYQTGLRFTDIYEDDYKALKTHLERLAERVGK